METIDVWRETARLAFQACQAVDSEDGKEFEGFKQRLARQVEELRTRTTSGRWTGPGITIWLEREGLIASTATRKLRFPY